MSGCPGCGGEGFNYQSIDIQEIVLLATNVSVSISDVFSVQYTQGYYCDFLCTAILSHLKLGNINSVTPFCFLYATRTPYQSPKYMRCLPF